MEEVKCQFEKLLNGEIFINDIKANVALNHLIRRIDDFKASTPKWRMPKLWFQYMQTMNIFRRFIKAVRTGDWTLHLQIVQEILPYRADIACMPNLFYIVRQTHRYWGG